MLTVEPGLIFNIAILAVMAVASYADIKTREVPNTYWIVLSAIGIIGIVFNYMTITTLLINVIAIAAIGIYYYVYKKTKLPGGDVKAIICLGICYPYQPLIPLMAILCGYVIAFAVRIGEKKKSLPLVPFFTVGLLMTLLLF